MNMWQAIARGAQTAPEPSAHASSKATVRPCPFCGTDPPLAERRAGRFLVGCEAEDCPANPQVSGATVEKAWAGWNRRSG